MQNQLQPNPQLQTDKESDKPNQTPTSDTPNYYPEYPESYDYTNQDSGFTEYDFYIASQEWKSNKIQIGNGCYIYKSNSNIWHIDSEND